MTQEVVIGLGRQALLTVLFVAAPALITGMTVGLLVSIFQAVTQIQEFTLTFVPKIVAVVTVFVIALPWIINTLLSFIVSLYSDFEPFVL